MKSFPTMYMETLRGVFNSKKSVSVAIGVANAAKNQKSQV